MTDKPHIVSISLDDHGMFKIDYVHLGDRHMGYHTLGNLIDRVGHKCIVEAALDLAGIDKNLSLKERVTLFNLTGTDR